MKNLCLCASVGRRTGHDHASEQKGDRSGKQTETAKGMKQECLHKQEPKSDSEHGPDRQSKKCSRARVAESRKRGEAEHAEISQNTKSRHRNSGDSGVSA